MLPGEPDPFLTDDDNPEITDEQMASMRPAADVLDPVLYDHLVRAQPVAESSSTAPVVLTLAPDVAARLRAAGPNWRDRADAILRRAVGLV